MLFMAGLMSLGGRLLFAQVPDAERIPITDPNRLQALGFPRDATNIYVWSRGDRGDPRSPQATAVSDEPETWGTATGYTTAAGFELQEESRYTKLDRLPGYTHCVSGLAGYVDYPTFAHVQFEAPDGAHLGFLRYWAYDSSTEADLIFRVYETRQESTSGSQPTTTLIGEGFTIGSGGDFNLFAPLNDYPVDNKDSFYFIQVEFAPSNVYCQQQELRIRKFSVSWTRQVSPAPATATFGDVPTDHNFFQFVEALAKSGITGGCGGGNYCPDAPLTRGQMAVFLAKALGLQWP
jgi:hypothetical protein